jgi:hypothetical protein
MKLRILVGLSLLLVSLLVLSPAAAVLAQEEAPPEVITLTTTYGKLSAIAEPKPVSLTLRLPDPRTGRRLLLPPIPRTSRYWTSGSSRPRPSRLLR